MKKEILVKENTLRGKKEEQFIGLVNPFPFKGFNSEVINLTLDESYDKTFFDDSSSVNSQEVFLTLEFKDFNKKAMKKFTKIKKGDKK